MTEQKKRARAFLLFAMAEFNMHVCVRNKNKAHVIGGKANSIVMETERSAVMQGRR